MLTPWRIHAIIGLLLCIFQCAGQQNQPQPPSQTTNAPQLTPQALSILKNQEPFQTFPVASTNGDVVGQLSNMIFDWNTGQARFGVVLLFEQVKQDRPFTVIPWELLKYSPGAKQIIVQVSTGKLRQAPTIKRDNLPASIEGDWGKEFYAFYRIKPTSGQARSAVGSGNGMLPSGTIKGSGANTPVPEDPVGRGAIFFLAACVVASLLVIGMLVRARRRGTA